MLGKNCQWVIYVVFSSIPAYTYVFLCIQYTNLLIPCKIDLFFVVVKVLSAFYLVLGRTLQLVKLTLMHHNIFFCDPLIDTCSGKRFRSDTDI
jgi:hypothetical protein